ncbi:ABC-F family ATP-binding cassette domain-containing protein [Sneathiella chinensis]|uniref:Glycosyl transferase family 1 n=1 Tax=Sneathiella chinensis TaxID=349750 RepID=A0ABQ5U6Z8_9PROT|nr:ABC-F family ATP-binding cassette domain-containing protein [Sneathiella chinensis]GLQ07561.1 glycosyl transferase family 1 [Sneathiella chinensis]
MLQINDLTYRIAGRTLLDDASVHIPMGHKVGLVGRNGTGKSTLLKLITGEIHHDSGSLQLRNGARLGVLPQEAPGGPESLIETVLAADLERASLLEEAETCEDPERIAHIHIRLADIDAHSAESRAARILAGLGFDHEAQQRPCSSFSGGWRTRVALAGTLFAEPDLLLLDEPSNYLDLEATLWLESFLRNYQRTLIIVSHDRDLLNNVVNTIVHLDQKKLVKYTGNYDFFEKTRAEKLMLAAMTQKKQDAKRKHLQSFVDRFRAKASKARQAQSRIKMLEKMKPVASVVEEYSVEFNFLSPEPLSSPIISMEECAVGYEEGKHILKHLNLRIDMDDRIALLGSNGNGKSTFAKLIAGRLGNQLGTLHKSGKLKIGFFAQHQLDDMIPTESAYQHLAAKLPHATEPQVRSRLGQFGFSKDKSDVAVQQLSGGEKARLNFCLLSVEKPHLLILDEPTNHLDVEAREALIEGLNMFEGAVLLISHDPHLVSLVADTLWLVAGGGVKAYDGDMQDYKKYVLEAARAASSGKRPDPAAEDSNEAAAESQNKLSGKEARQARAAARAALAPKRKAVKALENAVSKLEEKKAKLEEELAAPETYDKGTEFQSQLALKLGKIKADLEDAEETWMAALEELEALEKEGRVAS